MAVRSSADTAAQDWRIYKYPIDLHALDAEESIRVTMPAERRLLYATTQNEQIVFYALVRVDSTYDPSPCRLWVRGTGHRCHDMPPTALPLGVCSLRGGLLMFHVFASPVESPW